MIDSGMYSYLYTKYPCVYLKRSKVEKLKYSTIKVQIIYRLHRDHRDQVLLLEVAILNECQIIVLRG